MRQQGPDLCSPAASLVSASAAEQRRGFVLLIGASSRHAMVTATQSGLCQGLPGLGGAAPPCPALPAATR